MPKETNEPQLQQADGTLCCNGQPSALVKQSIAVDNGEGCAVDALTNSHLLVRSPTEALDLLLNPDRLASTLRY